MIHQEVNDQSSPLAFPQKRLEGTFLRSVLVFGASNLFYLALTSAMTFVIPKWLTIEDFAEYRFFLLFGGFAGAFHLGTVDGALIKWVEAPNIKLRSGFMPLVQFLLPIHILTIAMGAAAILFLAPELQRSTWMTILILLPVANTQALGQYALQALRRFSALSALTVGLPVCTLIIVVLLNRLHLATGLTVIEACLFSNAVAAAIGILLVKRDVRWSFVPFYDALHTGLNYLQLGWSVLIFNLFANFIFSADRFFIVARFSTRDFAIYSFAGAVFFSIYLVMLSISKVVFPYLADTSGPGRSIPYYRVREGLIILWALCLSLYFPIAFVIDRALPRYASSMPLVRLLLLATASIMLIQILHSNYYRLLNHQRTMTAVACAGAAATLACLFAVQHLHSLSAMAWATVTGCTIWGMAGEFFLMRFVHDTAVSLLRTVAGLAVFMIIFLYVSGHCHTLLSGFVLQLAITAAATLAIFLPTLRSFRKVLLKRVESRK
jgi:O-antigen/teichoic acid export membrane protein